MATRTNDIARLRQQNTLGGIPDMSGGTMGMGMDMNYGPSPSMGGPPPTFPDWGIPSSVYGTPQGPQQPEWQGPLQVPEVGQTTQPTSIDDLLAQVNRFYTPSTAASDRFNNQINQYPQREEPSLGRKLVAGGLGLDARQRLGTPFAPLAARGNPIPVMEQAMYAPHIRDVADWKEQITPMQQAATLENAQNVNERNLAKDVFTTKYNQDRLERTSQIAEEKNRIAQKRVDDQREIGLINAKAREAKANGADVKIEQGVAVLTYPDGRIETLKIPDTATDAELANIRGRYQVEASRQRGADAITRTEESGWMVMTDPSSGRSYSYNPRTGEKRDYIPGTSSPQQKLGTPSASRPETKAQFEMQRQEKMRELAGNPDHSKWFSEDPTTGLITMKPRPTVPSPGMFTSDETIQRKTLDQQHWDWVNSQLNPSYKPPNPTTTPAKPGIGPTQQPAPATTTIPQEAAGNTPQGRIPVYDKDGNLVGHIPNTPEQRALAVKQGYKVR